MAGYSEVAPKIALTLTLKRGSKNVSEQLKIYSQFHRLCKFDTPGDRLRERKARGQRYCLHLPLNIVANAVFSNCRAVFSSVSLCNAVFFPGFLGRSKLSERSSTPTRSVPAPRREKKPAGRALQIIVESAAVVSKHSSAILRVNG